MSMWTKEDGCILVFMYVADRYRFLDRIDRDSLHYTLPSTSSVFVPFLKYLHLKPTLEDLFQDKEIQVLSNSEIRIGNKCILRRKRC